MNIIDEYKTRYHNNILMAAIILDSEAAFALEDRYEELWNSGQSFGLFNCFVPRKEDSEEQIQAFCKSFDNALRKLIMDCWIRQYDREQIVAMLNLLVLAPDRNYTRITLAHGYDVCLEGIRDEWNRRHPDEPIYNSETVSV